VNVRHLYKPEFVRPKRVSSKHFNVLIRLELIFCIPCPQSAAQKVLGNVRKQKPWNALDANAISRRVSSGSFGRIWRRMISAGSSGTSSGCGTAIFVQCEVQKLILGVSRKFQDTTNTTRRHALK
jgi:hypothetical protein